MLVNYKKLTAPLSYTLAPDEIKELICNGCGTKGWGGVLVPDTAWGMRLTRACNIHDWMYSRGITEESKVEADETFLKNMRALVALTPWWAYPLRPMRYARAYEYYLAVKHWGDTAFWAGKS